MERSGKKPHKCPVCDYSYSAKGKLRQHIESVHEGKKPHKCSICEYSCSAKGTLRRHIESVHEENKPHKCSICDFSCSRKETLKHHIQSAHEGGKKQLFKKRSIEKTHPIRSWRKNRTCAQFMITLRHIQSVHIKNFRFKDSQLYQIFTVNKVFFQ